MPDHTERAPARSTAGSGRFAPSPSGDLHVGNLRTAVLGWLFARSTGRRFQVRLEDLDRVQPGAAQRQLADLSAIGLDWDGAVVRQSGRPAFYRQAIDRLQHQGLVYPCFCTRREIQEAASAPQESPGPDGPDGAYPGTCRKLTAAQRTERLAAGRPPALRLRAQVPQWTVHDALLGSCTGAVDDFVLRRTDGVFAYNLAVVVDDAAQAVDQVVRGADLLTSAPRQMYLAYLLGLAQVDYAHVPLARNAAGARLAKRDGAVTLADLREAGLGAPDVLNLVAVSLDLAVPGERVDPPTLLARFDPRRLPRQPWVFEPPTPDVRPA